MDLIHNGGGGVSVRIHFSRIFFTFNVKNMSKNWKRMIKQWWEKNIVHIWGGGAGGGFRVSWTKSIYIFFFTSLNLFVLEVRFL